jgi:hypothetical protein
MTKKVEKAAPKVLSMRLTNAIKLNVVALVCDKKFGLPEKKVQEDMCHLARDVYADQVSQWANSAMMTMEDGFFQEGNHIRAFLAGKECRLDLGEKRRIPWKLALQWEAKEVAATYPPGHKFDVRFEKLELVRRKLSEDRARLSATCWSVLNSVTTTAKLREIWPEVDEFLPTEYVKEQPCVAIVVRVDTLRELLRK